MKKDTSRAVEFLEEMLSEGPMDQADVVRLGKETGFTERICGPREKNWA